MRRALQAQWPALAERFGVLPWHFDGGPPVLTFGEQQALYEFLEQERIDAAFRNAFDSLPKG